MGPLVPPASPYEDIACEDEREQFGRKHSEALPSIHSEELRERTLRGGAQAHGNVIGKQTGRGAGQCRFSP